MLTSDLPTLIVEGVAVAIARRISKPARDMAVLLDPPELLIARNVAP
jgi:hypothetical protein